MSAIIIIINTTIIITIFAILIIAITIAILIFTIIILQILLSSEHEIADEKA